MADCYWDALGLSHSKICVLLLFACKKLGGGTIKRERVYGLYHLTRSCENGSSLIFICFFNKMVDFNVVFSPFAPKRGYSGTGTVGRVTYFCDE